MSYVPNRFLCAFVWVFETISDLYVCICVGLVDTNKGVSSLSERFHGFPRHWKKKQNEEEETKKKKSSIFAVIRK